MATSTKSKTTSEDYWLNYLKTIKLKPPIVFPKYPKSWGKIYPTDPLKGKSLKYITEKNAEWKKVVSIDADKIDRYQKDKVNYKSQIDKDDEYLKQASGYTNARDGYNAQAKTIADDEAKLKKLAKKSKDSKKRKAIENDIKTAEKNKKDIAEKIKKITSDPKYKKYMDQRQRAMRGIKTADLAIKAKQALKAKDKKKYLQYHHELTKRKERKAKKLEKKNGHKINEKIAAAKKKWPQKWMGQTALYRTDCKTDRLYMLAEMQPSETVSFDVNQNPVDDSDPRSNYTVEDSKELTGTYYLYGKSFEECDRNYKIIEGWGRKSVELSIRGFSKLKHCKISSVGKAVDTPYRNVLELPITLSYVLPAKIDYAKTNKKTKAKAKTGKKKGTSKSTKRSVVVKKGETLLEIARKANVKYSEIKKMNAKDKDLSLKSGETVRVS